MKPGMRTLLLSLSLSLFAVLLSTDAQAQKAASPAADVAQVVSVVVLPLKANARSRGSLVQTLGDLVVAAIQELAPQLRVFTKSDIEAMMGVAARLI